MSTTSTALLSLATDPSLKKAGWDGYKAAPLDPATVTAAQAFLNAIAAVPTAKGGVQLEIHTHHLDIEIEFKPNGSVEWMVGGSKHG